MKLNKTQILNRANQIYLQRKIAKGYPTVEDLKYMPPEAMPQIQSDQVLALLDALVEAIGKTKCEKQS
jgi:hypothetical protein